MRLDPTTADWSKYETVAIGKAEIREAGDVIIKFRPKDAASWRAINLQVVTLQKAK